MITVNGRGAKVNGSVLETCTAAGADVPAICHHERLSVGGHCRSCIVEVDGQFVAACSTQARDGMSVLTDSKELREYRRDLGELMLKGASPSGEARHVLDQWGADGSRYGPHSRIGASDYSHPYLRLDPDACILCRRCIRACDEIQGQFVYAITGRGANAGLYSGEGGFSESACVSCGACVEVCPSGAISDVHETVSPEDQPVRTTCAYCGVGCQLEVVARDGEILSVRGTESPVNHGHLCVKGRFAHSFSSHPDRLKTPLIRKNRVLQAATWDEALDLVARKLIEHKGAVAGLSSARCTNEENYLFQKLFRTALATNDVDCCARVCHAPSAAGMKKSFGIGAATNSFADIDVADLFLIAGANVTEAHPVIGARIKQAVLRGAKLIVIDPRKTELAAMADVHLQVRPGGNVPLLNAIAFYLCRAGLIDFQFIERRVESHADMCQYLALFDSAEAAEAAGVPERQIQEAARLYGAASRPMMFHGLGVTEHLQGSEAVMLLCNLALMRGALGRPGVGVNPLRGQNNVQGAVDMGCAPDMLPGYQSVSDNEARTRLERLWGGPIPSAPGRTIPEMFDAVLAGKLKAMYILGEDVVQTDPNTSKTRAALEALDFLVVQELFLSETAKMADVVLPGASAFEKDGTFTNAERRIQRVRRVVDPPGDARSDWSILIDLTARMDHIQAYSKPSEIMNEIARIAPLFRGVSYDRLNGDGLQWPVPTTDHPGTPILHIGEFAGGKAKLALVEYTPSPSTGHGLLLTTGRILEHYNSGSMTRRSDNSRIAETDLLEIHSADAHKLGISDGDGVVLKSRNGSARAVAEVTDRVPPGVVFLSFHFPETGVNNLIGDVRDRVTGCPEYKVTAVEVRKA